MSVVVLGVVLVAVVAVVGVTGVVSVPVLQRWLAAQREIALAKSAVQSASREGQLEDGVEKLPAYVDREDPAAVDAWRRAQLEIAESWER
jgi:hypothetical protein